MEYQLERVAQNEALFRAVNEKLLDLNFAFSGFTDRFSIVCECGDLACVEEITLTKNDYARLRSEATLFAIIRGHEVPVIEEVVERQEAYDVVRKREGGPAAVAEDADT